MNKFEANFGKWVVKHRWWVIAATSIIIFFIFNGLQFLTVNMDNRVFFSEDNPQLQALEALEDTYLKSNNVLIVIAPKDGNVLAAKTLSVVEELTEISWQIPYSSRVNSITNFQHTQVEEDDLIVADLVENASSLKEEDLEYVKNVALSEPLLVNRLISPTGHVTGIYIEVILPGKSQMEVPEVAMYTQKIIEEFKIKHPDIEFYLTGSTIMDMAFGVAGQQDMSTLIPLMFLILVVITGIALRSIIGTFSTLIIIVISMITGMGLAGWLGFVINSASANAPTIIMTLAVANSVHILSTMYQQLRLGNTKYESITESLRINLMPVFITNITTAIGFLAMNFSDAPPYRDFGNIVSMGMVGAFLYSIIFLPALLAVLPVRAKLKSKKQNKGNLLWLANFVINRRKAIFVGSIVMVSIMTLGILKIELQDDWVKYFDKSFDVRNATDFYEENLTGFNAIEYSLEAEGTGGINDPQYLEKLEEFGNWLLTQPKVVHVNSITEILKRLNKNMHGDDESFYRLPDKRDLAAQYLLLYEMSLPFGLDLNNQINVDKSATRLIVTLKDVTTREIREMEDRGNAWLKANAPASMYSPGTGLAVTWAHLSERNINSLLGGTFWAFLLISAAIVFALRSWKHGLLSLIPNVAPAFMAFGMWGLIVGQAGLGISMIAAMTIGIVVDDTVHFLSKYLRARREYNLNPFEAVRYSFETVGKAMWVTTLALVSGFMVLTLSGFRMNADMGWMAAITIIFALLMDFLFLPTLLIKVDNKSNEIITNYKEVYNETDNYEDSIYANVVPVNVHDELEG